AFVSPGAREAAEYGLMEMGALGTETSESAGGVRVTAYFSGSLNLDRVRAGLLDSLRIYGCSPNTLIELRSYEVPDRDWLELWKQHWQPFEVGRFVIAPTWIKLGPSAAGGSAGSLVIRVDPGMAFGTGTHETTRLCLKAIEKYFKGGSFLDVGTGTGILAIAGAKMFPAAHIEACDTDSGAIAIAKENARVNGLSDRINFRVGTVEEGTSSVDLVCANL